MTQPTDPQQPADQPTPAWPVPSAAPEPQHPGYTQPVDPFFETTNTPPSAQVSPAHDPTNPYTAPTYYPTGSAAVPPPPTAPVSATPYPYPGHQGYPGFPVAPVPPPKKRHKGLIITAIVLGVLLLLCGAGGVAAYVLLNGGEGKGADTASTAAQEFLTAIYKERNATKAEALVCKEARDRKAIDSKIKELEDKQEQLKSPAYTWDTIKVENQTETRGESTITIKLTTSDEKVAEQTVKLELVKRDGWFVCEVREIKK